MTSVVPVPALWPAIDIAGVGGATVRWRYRATSGYKLRPGSRMGWLLVLAPIDCVELTVRALAEFDLSPEDDFGLRPIPTEDTFTVRLPNVGAPALGTSGSWPSVGGLAPAASAAASSFGSGTMIRLGFVVDIVGFSKRTEPAQNVVQERLIKIVLRAVEDAGVAPRSILSQTTGDGMNIFLPPDIDLAKVLGRLLHAMPIRLGEDNLRYTDRLRLRMAADIGPVGNSRLGFSGDTVNSFGRLVDSRPIREAIESNPAADVAVLISNTLNTMVLRHGYPDLADMTFREVTAIVKGYQSPAWLWVGPKSPASVESERARDVTPGGSLGPAN